MCTEKCDSQGEGTSRRRFLQHAGVVGAGLMLAGPMSALGLSNQSTEPRGKIASRGYAARNNSGVLSPWEFQRRALREDDVLVDIKYCGVCHSDIHKLRGEWGEEKYPQVPGHEITGIVASVGSKVTKFKPGDRVGVGPMVDSCGQCDNCKNGLEQHCQRWQTKFTYGFPDDSLPTGITQGGYSINVLVKDRFVIRIPDRMRLQDAAPLLCAGITTYSPLMRESIKEGDKVGVVGIGGLGHVAVKLAASKGAEVHAFTSTEPKVDDIRAFGAKNVVVVRTPRDLGPHFGSLDYCISTIPVDYNIGYYATLVRPFGSFTQVGMPKEGKLTLQHFMMTRNRVNLNGSMIGGIPETQEVIDYCARNNIKPDIEIISAEQTNDAWNAVVDKKARYRYVIDISTI
ncbi:alcohol dehydrogenase catalytic domain-containing protein [candidate division GN15 bacterium]|nr:alcohol dehydrogenase catalytic domain-containing protein [candidate division GN15 bacterium]